MKNTQRILWLVIATLFYANFLSAQQKTIDSLNDLLTKQTSDREKGRINIKIAREYISFDTISAKAYLKKGLELADETNDDLGRGMYELYNAYLLCNRGFYKDGPGRRLRQ